MFSRRVLADLAQRGSPRSALGGKTYSTRPKVILPHHQYVIRTPHQRHNMRLDITQLPHFIGVRSTRGVREYNEDRYKVRVLRLDSQTEQQQAVFLGVYDGHGGARCVDYLSANLHRNIEGVTLADVRPVLRHLQNLGESWQEYEPELLLDAIDRARSRDPQSTNDYHMSLPTRLTLAFLKTDLDLYRNETIKDGSTASAVLMEALDGLPFWSSDHLRLTAANVGDTSGLARELSRDHHADDPAELIRIKRTGGFVDADAFGEFMALGRVANTRSFGDRNLKSFGVIAEPTVFQHDFSTKDLAFLVIITDGITSVLDNQEIIDLIRPFSDPTQAAIELVDMADRAGSSDNMTALIVALPGWNPALVTHRPPVTTDRDNGRDPSLGSLIGVRTEEGSSPVDLDAGATRRHGGWIGASSRRLDGTKGKVDVPIRTLLTRLYASAETLSLSATPQPNGAAIKLNARQIREYLAQHAVALSMDTAVSEDGTGSPIDTPKTVGEVSATNARIVQLSYTVLGRTGDPTAQDGEEGLTTDELYRAWRLLDVKAWTTAPTE
ncbi:Protein phosphatase 2C 6 [Tieghemiomyces parasiticus]|uniref:Protein phosphatase 2C 6 n=1 Tax=Tieghemiomyces parasiticus TaxID=78921 RepID=A0A9W8E2H6_9FUNG|nr:Protein phosphatase 2C 6 [Tieghemiomyces parasiticus]